MTIPLTLDEKINDNARVLLNEVKNAYRTLNKANAAIALDDYSILIDFPLTNKGLQAQFGIVDALSGGGRGKIVKKINEELPSDIAFSDIRSFVNKFNAVAVIVENASNGFRITFDPTNKLKGFTIADNPTLKNNLQTRITAALAEVV